jgi:hypothetical protein
VHAGLQVARLGADEGAFGAPDERAWRLFLTPHTLTHAQDMEIAVTKALEQSV